MQRKSTYSIKLAEINQFIKKALFLEKENGSNIILVMYLKIGDEVRTPSNIFTQWRVQANLLYIYILMFLVLEVIDASAFFPIDCFIISYHSNVDLMNNPFRSGSSLGD